MKPNCVNRIKITLLDTVFRTVFVENVFWVLGETPGCFLRFWAM